MIREYSSAFSFEYAHQQAKNASYLIKTNIFTTNHAKTFGLKYPYPQGFRRSLKAVKFLTLPKSPSFVSQPVEISKPNKKFLRNSQPLDFDGGSLTGNFQT